MVREALSVAIAISTPPDVQKRNRRRPGHQGQRRAAGHHLAHPQGLNWSNSGGHANRATLVVLAVFMRQRTRQDYTQQFKDDAVDLAESQGCGITEAGRRLGVNRSNIERWRREGHGSQGPGSDKRERDDELAALHEKVQAIAKEKRNRYGSRRMGRALTQKGLPVGRFQARSLMREAGVEVHQRRPWKATKDRNPRDPSAR